MKREMKWRMNIRDLETKQTTDSKLDIIELTEGNDR